MSPREKLEHFTNFETGWIAEELRKTQRELASAQASAIVNLPISKVDDVISLLRQVGVAKQATIDLLAITKERLKQENSNA